MLKTFSDECSRNNEKRLVVCNCVLSDIYQLYNVRCFNRFRVCMFTWQNYDEYVEIISAV